MSVVNVLGRRGCFGLVVIIFAFLISNVSGALISGSEGTAYLVDSNDGYTINVRIDFAVYDGQDSSDPLGATIGQMQIGFVLTHLGAESGHGSDTVLNLGRFVAHNPEPASIAGYGYDAGTSGTAPHAPAAYGGAMGLETGDAVFNFIGEWTYVADFTPSSVSKELAIALNEADVPEQLLIETDELYYPIGEINTTIDIVPEPTSIALFSIALSSLYLRKRKK